MEFGKELTLRIERAVILSGGKLVYFEQTSDVRAALEREKQLKGWKRSKKNALVEKMNPQWKDLYPLITGEETDSSTRSARSE